MKGMALEEFALRFTQAVAHFMWIGVLLALVLLVIDRFLLRTAAARHGLHLAGVLLLTLALPVCFVVVDGSGPELRIVLPTGIVEQKMDSGPVTAAPAELGFGVEEPGLLIPAGVLGEIAEPVASPIPAADVVDEVVVEVETGTTAGTPWLERSAPWVVAIYLVGLLLMTGRLIVGLAGTRRLRRSCDPVESGTWTAGMRKMCATLGVRTRPLLAWSREVAAPVLIGIAKPMVLLPVALASRLSPGQLEAVLAHELAHLRRLDPWAVALQRVVETLLFFHPAVWWMSRRLDRFREEACDDLVVAAGCDPADYAEALLRCSELRLKQAGLSGRLVAQLSATGKGGAPLRRRVLRLLGQNERAPIRPGRAGWVLGAAALAGLVLAAASGYGVREDLRDEKLPELSITQQGEVKRLVKGAGTRNEAELDEIINSLVAIGPGVASEMIPLLRSGGSDVVGTRVLQELAPDLAVQNLLVKAVDEARDRHPNVIHCGLIALGASGNREHADFFAGFLETNDIVATSALARLGGEQARDHLIAAFDVVPTEHWWHLAESLEKLGDSAAVPELRKRLGQVELPPNEQFPERTVWSLTNAISTLSGKKGRSNLMSYVQGQRFRYPYDGPGAPKTFSVDPPNGHYAKLPEVDPESAAGRAAIWRALEDATEGPGFTVDGDEVVLFHGLKAVPLWANGPPYPTTLLDWLEETPHQLLRKLVAQEGQTERCAIPQGGWLIALDPAGRLHALSLKRRSEPFAYTVGILPQDPNLQLIPVGADWNAMRFTRISGCTLHDLESDQQNGCLNLSRGHMDTLTEDRWSSERRDALLTVEFASGGMALAVGGAEEFHLVDAKSVAGNPQQVAQLLKAAGGIDPEDGHQVVRDEGGIFHVLPEAAKGRTYAFAVAMPDGLPVAGLLEIGDADRKGETLRIRQRFLPTVAARQVFGEEEAAVAPEQPSLPKMVSVSSDEVGVTFDRPAEWIVDKEPPPHNGPGVDFAQPLSMVDDVRASLSVSMEDAGGRARIDVTSPGNPKATARRIFEIDGEPARLTVQKVNGKDYELLRVAVARGARFYEINMVFPQKRHDEYLRLALAVCKSLRFHKWGEPVDGVQCRLVAERSVWKTGQSPKFEVIPRTSADADLRLAAAIFFGCRVEIDGKWYEWSGDQRFVGQAYSSAKMLERLKRSLSISLEGANLTGIEGKEKLNWPEGKHTVRFAWAAYPLGETPESNEEPPLRLISNPVEIEIAPDEPATGDAFQLEIDRTISSDPFEDEGDLDLKSALRADLSAPEFETRRRAAIELHKLGDNSGVPALIEAMTTLTNQSERNNAVVALRITKDPRSIPILTRATSDSSAYVRSIALEALGELAATNAYDVIVSHLTDLENFGGSVQGCPGDSACYALGALGEKRAIPVLMRALDQRETQSQACQALETLTGQPFRYDVEKWKIWWRQNEAFINPPAPEAPSTGNRREQATLPAAGSGEVREVPSFHSFDDDPDFAKALQFDSEHSSDRANADCDKAIEFYLKYLEKDEVPAYQRARVYVQLAVQNTTLRDPRKDQERDPVKAEQYLRKAIELDPDRISRTMSRARTLWCSTGGRSSEDYVRKHMEVYDWLLSIDEEAIEKRAFPVKNRVSIRNGIESARRVTAANALGVVRSLPDSEARLRRLMADYPGTPVAEQAWWWLPLPPEDAAGGDDSTGTALFAFETPLRVEAVRIGPDGTLSARLVDDGGERVEACFDERPDTATRGRMFLGGGDPDQGGARLAGWDEEQEVNAALRSWLDARVSAGKQQALLARSNGVKGLSDPARQALRVLWALGEWGRLELVGICALADQRRWWAPDGTLLNKVPWDATECSRFSNPDGRHLLVFRLDGAQSDPDRMPTVQLEVYREGRYSGSWNGRPFAVLRDGKPVANLHGFFIHDAQDRPDVELRAVIDQGPWRLAGTGAAGPATKGEPGPSNAARVVVHDVAGRDGRTTMQMSMSSPYRGVWRPVAIDQSGRVHPSTSQHASAAKGMKSGVPAEFALPKSEIVRFHYQVRETVTIRHRNVSLRPGAATDLEVGEFRTLDWSRFPTEPQQISWDRAVDMIRSGRVVFVKSHNSRKVILGTSDYRLYLTKLKNRVNLYSLLDEVDPEHVKIKHMSG